MLPHKSEYRQDLIREYYEYGYTIDQIVEELNMAETYVKMALFQRKYNNYMYIPGQRARALYTKKNHYVICTVRRVAMYEFLYKFGIKEINRRIAMFGIRPAAHYLRVPINEIVALRKHFGYNNDRIPPDSMEYLTYFSENLREGPHGIDERDERICQKCGKDMNNRVKEIRYHKISHPGPMIVDNAITICHWCRRKYAMPITTDEPRMLMGMRFQEFKELISNDTKKRYVR